MSGEVGEYMPWESVASEEIRIEWWRWLDKHFDPGNYEDWKDDKGVWHSEIYCPPEILKKIRGA